MQPPDPNKTIYIIDAHAQIFRAYFAIRGGMNSPVTGEPTQALYGVAGVLLKLLTVYKPHYVIIATDAPGKTFRDDLYPAYKAQRPEPPADLIAQIPRVFEMARLFGIPVIGHTGAEADDVIATITHRVTHDPRFDDFHVRVVSKDKDLEQLLDDRVAMFDIQTDTLIDVKWLWENKAVTPRQVIDLLALTGDSVDNVPGVPGVGPKTAAQLIGEFGSIEGIYKNLDKIKGKKRENLEASKEIIPLSRQLVTLKHDLDMPLDLDDLKLRPIQAVALRGFFAQMGFRTHTGTLNKLIGEAPAATGDESSGQAASQQTAEAADTGLFAQTAKPAAKPTTARPEDKPNQQAGLFDSLFDNADEPAQGSPNNTANVPSSSSAGFVAQTAQQNSQQQQSPYVPNEALPAGYTTAKDFSYTAITTKAQLQKLADTLSKQPIFALDTETIGLGKKSKICGISFAWEPGKAVYVPTASPEQSTHLTLEEALAVLRPLLENPAIHKTGHNIKYDLLVLRAAGVKVGGVVFDTFIGSTLAGLDSHGLDHLALHLLKHRMIGIEELIGPEAAKGQSSKTMDSVPLSLITAYAAGDADVSLRLYHVIRPRIDELGMKELADRIEMPLVSVLASMEHAGIRVDPKVLTQQKQEIGQKAMELREQIITAAGVDFNPDSPKQLADVLFVKLGLPVIKKTKTGPSTDAEVLEKLTEREDLPPEKLLVPHLIGEYRQLTKLLGTYLDALKDAIDPVTHRIHASFHQTGAATGRLSSSGPNLQNIPIRSEVGRQIRKAFIAEPGKTLVVADYSQIELRVLAHFSKDPAMLDAFARDMDIHTAVAAQVWSVAPENVTREQRAGAKTINFGIIYGVSPYGLSRQVPGMSVDAAKTLINDYKARFKGINLFLQECVEHARANGYVKTIMGRRRAIPEIFEKSQMRRALGERLAINTVIQGSAADLIKLAMVNLDRRLDAEKIPGTMLLQIHDELVIEADTAATELVCRVVKEEMENAMKLDVPLRVETGTGPSWYEAK